MGGAGLGQGEVITGEEIEQGIAGRILYSGRKAAVMNMRISTLMMASTSGAPGGRAREFWARRAGYGRVRLWTHSVLTAA